MNTLTMPASNRVPPSSEVKAVPADLQRFMAFDFGTRRTGVAVGSRMLGAAQPQATISVSPGRRAPRQYAARAKVRPAVARPLRAAGV